MSPDIEAMMKTIREEVVYTNVTSTTHRTVYPSISPTRPELSQSGRTVIIPGGGQGVGFEVADAFIKASAAQVILVGRRAEVLEAAAERLRNVAQREGSTTKIVARSCDLVDVAAVDAFWEKLSDDGITVDVWVHSAVRISQPEPMLKLGAAEIWAQIETNVKGSLYFAERFVLQAGDQQKFIVNISSAIIHGHSHPFCSIRPGYILSKTGQSLYFQLLASEIPPNKVQIVSYHPGLIYNDHWQAMGVEADQLDDPSLCGGVAVWMASKEAEFLHGRFMWSAWDVDELRSGHLRKRIDEDHYFLRVSVSGLKVGRLA